MQRTSFNENWQTRRHANAFAEMAGGGDGWRPVTLPHDSTIGEPRNPSHGAASGYFPGGVYEYRKVFAVPTDFRDKRVTVEFEGVYRRSMVYVNGSLAGNWASGYSGFTVELDDYLRFGQNNEIRVVCRAHQDSRWYAGAGIHRPVHLLVGKLLHIPIDGVQVITKSVDADFAVVEVAITVKQSGRGLATGTVVTELIDPGRVPVASDRVPVSVVQGEPAIVRQQFLVPHPALWSPESPSLYTATVTLRDGTLRDGTDSVDKDTVTFGIRTLSVDPARGLRINGEMVKLRGACIHADNGVVGAAAIDRADERRVQLLKAAGFNALRSAHNPASRALLEACDRFGMLVMDESVDMWTQNKSDFDDALDFPQWWERELEAMVRKDFNHPSVVFYSIGNEIPEVGTPFGAMWSRRLAEKVRSLDNTRMVTNGVNGMLAVLGEALAERAASAEGAGINTMLTDMGEFMAELSASELVGVRTVESFGVLDVAGMNYMDRRYEADHRAFRSRVIVGSETFPGQIDHLWRLVTDHPHVIGDFTWTGWDYLGEAGIGRVADSQDPTAGQFNGPYPWLLAYCGDLDITGHRRPQSYYREIVFGLRSEPYLAVQRPEHFGRTLVGTPWACGDTVASWSWAGVTGGSLTVDVFSDAEEVELLLNGRSLGIAPVGEKNRFRAAFKVPFTPGELTAVAWTGGVETGRHTLVSATGPMMLAAVADRDVIRADDTDLAFVDITLQDADGTVFVGADQIVTVAVDGPAVLQGLGSAAPATEEPYTADRHATFDGRALAVLRPTGPGSINVTVSADGRDPVRVLLLAR